MKLLRGLALAALVLAVAQPARAQDRPPGASPITGFFERAFDGQNEDLPWAVGVLTLSNQTDADLTVTIVHNQESGANVVRQEQIGRHATVKVQLVVPQLALYGGETNIEVRNAAGRILWQQKTETSISRRYTGGETSPTVLALTGPRPSGLELWSVYTAREAYLPQRAVAYRGFHAILLRDYRLEQLIPAQINALLEWVAAGGTLVVYPGANASWLTSDGMRLIAPIQLGASSVRTSLPRLEQEFGALELRASFAFQNLKNGTPLTSSETPEAVEFRRGLGRVIVVAFDLDGPPFDRWQGKHGFLEALVKPAAPPGVIRFDVTGSPVTSALTGAHDVLPSFLLLFGIAVTFIVIVSPANFVLLRRIERPQLLLATIPGIAAVFVLLIVATGYLFRGASTISSEVVLLEARDGDGVARRTRALSIFSPASRAFTLTWPGTEIGLPVEHDLALNSTDWRHPYRTREASLSIGQDRAWVLRNCGFAQWQARVFIGRGTQEIGGGVRVNLDGANLSVSNGTPWRIVRGFAVEGRRAGGPQLIPFGEVPAGAERAFVGPSESPKPEELGLSPFELRILRPWLKDVTGRALMGRVALCIVDAPIETVAVDATLSRSSERLCLLQVFGEGP